MKKTFCSLFILSLFICLFSSAASMSYDDLSIEELENLRSEIYSRLVLINESLAKKQAQERQDTVIEPVPLGSTIISLFPDEGFAIYIRDQLGKISINDTVTQEELDNITAFVIYGDSDYEINSLEGISHLRNLNYFLFAKYIPELPDEMAELNCIEYFSLSQYKQTQLPSWFTNFTALQSLRLSLCDITNLPEDIDRFTSLKYLELWNTRIIELPESISHITSLEEIKIFISKMSVLPEWIGNILSLKKLTVSYANIKTLPDTIGNLSNLLYLDCSDSNLEQLPESIGNLKNLRTLNLENTNISELPASIYNLNIPNLNIRNTNIK